MCGQGSDVRRFIDVVRRQPYWDDDDRSPPVPLGRLKVFRVFRQEIAELRRRQLPVWRHETTETRARKDDNRMLGPAIPQLRQQAGDPERTNLVKDLRLGRGVQIGDERRAPRTGGTGRMREQHRLR